jgi:glycosyltransferase involved in cell wall biosynthesis
MQKQKKLIAIIIPFLDKKHGTEKCIAEQIERLSEYYEFHIYSNKVEDIKGISIYKKNYHSQIYWHKIPIIKGPHLLKYIWWFIANHIWRLKDYLLHNLKYDIKYSSGVDCLDADLIVVHHIFIEFYKCVRKDLRLSNYPIKSWPLIIHRHLYYILIIIFEYLIYKRKKVILGAISSKVANLLYKYYKKKAFVVYPGVDFINLSTKERENRYKLLREKYNIKPSEFVILLIGNDWCVKGLIHLLRALDLLKNLPLHLLIRGDDDKTLYIKLIKDLNISHKITFLEPIPNIIDLYLAADLYVSPSLYDSFALPPAEAMACGLPVIVSSKAGVSEIIDDNISGIILNDPSNYKELAEKIALLYKNSILKAELSQNAIEKIRKYTWEKNAQIMKNIIDSILFNN